MHSLSSGKGPMASVVGLELGWDGMTAASFLRDSVFRKESSAEGRSSWSENLASEGWRREGGSTWVNRLMASYLSKDFWETKATRRER